MMDYLGKHLGRLALNYGFQDMPKSAKSGCKVLPLLEKVTIRFPDTTHGSWRRCFKEFQDDRMDFFEGLKTFINATRIKSFEFEDLRDFAKLSDDDSANQDSEYGQAFYGLMNQDGPRFDMFTKDLNEALDLECKDETEIVHQGNRGRGGNWEIYKAKEVWTANAGGYLVWKNEETEETTGPVEEDFYVYGSDDYSDDYSEEYSEEDSDDWF